MAKLDIVCRLEGKDKIYDQSFTICWHKTEQPKNIEIPTSISLYVGSFSVKQSAFPQPRMATFQTCDKIDILHPKTLSDMTLSELNNSIFQSNEKISKIAYFFAQPFGQFCVLK